MPNYQNSRIYKIVCLTTGKVYVGSTTMPLSKRLAKHVENYKRYQNGKYHNVSSYEVLENGNYRIELIKAFPCNNKEELHSEEGKFIREIDCINMRIAGRTRGEWYQDNRERHLVKFKANYEKHKAELRAKVQCECGVILSKACLTRHKKRQPHITYMLNQTNGKQT